MDIRRATTADAQGIADVHVRTWQEAYRGLMPQDYLDGLDVVRGRTGWDLILAETHWPRAGALVAENDQGIIGFVYLCPSRDDGASEAVGEITALYVVPSAWGAGAGRTLMEAATHALRAADFTEATLWVLETNARARRFYDLAGWTADGTEESVELGGTSVREVRYSRPLT